MRKERKELQLDAVLLNEGQVDWLPRNPRTWTQTDIDKTAASIVEDPDFLEERPILVIPFQGKTYIAFAGNLRHEGSKAAKRATAPCVIYYPETEADREAVRRRAMKDNGSFGKFDWDEIANNPVWGRMRLADFGIPVWDPDASAGVEQEEGTGAGSPDDYGEEFNLPDGEKSPFQQMSFQLSNEMAEILSLAIKAAQYSEEFYDIEGDEQDKNGNGVAAYLIAKEWCEKHLQDMTSASFQDAEKEAQELRQYLRDSLKASGKRAKDIDEHLGTSGMSGHYLGSSQWMFPTLSAYEKMREIMPLPRDYFECKKIELRYNLLKTLQDYK